MALHNLNPAKHRAAQDAIDAAQDAASAAKDVGGSEALALTDVGNIDTITIVGVCHFQRVDDTVTVSGAATVDTSGAGATTFGIAFPTGHGIANVAAATEVHGTYVDAAGDVGVIDGDASNERAECIFTAAADASRVGYFTFSYVAD